MLQKWFGPFTFYREALSIALPVMLQQFIMSMVSLIDNFMVAGLGDATMAAVNVANQINFVHLVAINTVCGAGGIYLAQFKGAGDGEGMKHAYRFKILFTCAASGVYSLLCWTMPEEMLGVMTKGNAAQDAIVFEGARYIKLTAFTLFPAAISASVGSAFREMGRPKVPLAISACATGVNTFGNWLLIYGNLGAPRLEAEGAAIATILARGFEALLFLGYAHFRRPDFFVGFRRILAVNGALIKEILGKSGMIFASEASWISSETIMTAIFNGRGGAEVVAGMAAGWTIANVFFLLFGGIWTTAAVLVGGTLGAGNLDEARRRAGWLTSGSAAAGGIVAVFGGVFAVLAVPLVFANLTDSARSIALGLVFVILVYLPFWGILNAMFAISRAGGDAALGMYTDLSVNTLLFVPGCFLLAWKTGLDPVRMFAILKVTDFLKILVARYFLKKERWVRNLTKPQERI
ncbi:MAG: MATE family efflux transporter [Spirochaetaceae bacterium]|jgi:Na+-driven multidrug efflux pump|nr:MATE family efflux transporter [Spirochaetaceae bacterium]